MNPKIKSTLLWVGIAALIATAWRSLGWAGLAFISGGLLMWVLLHFNRLMMIVKRATNKPIGYVDSAVMLNAKLQKGHALLHVIALTRALGERLSEPDAQPEIFRWTDNSASSVTCEFANGKLTTWALHRPPEDNHDQSDQP